MKKQKVLIKTTYFYYGINFNYLNLLNFIYFRIKRKGQLKGD
ncbi:hypothetical protein XBJ1_2737 [Xenorhabdus bovienii SS-2004]|uniref:Uncharacterized protein n=1 Tax=Xenorhabdus bovienii (strain SS-2004) TaxID=406818 RepID=D3V7P9_XENBS|nr:hypothetical protein XBJ1_2737 [Xenorhabdus bovienii SS-2004]